ncbi:hypothetical protein [Photobacterium leiognathi]|uniref:hypothetical protein n=1 Tax=Photobacterium leiognathi TaxID=553611 RepID=UPI000D158C4F|nr:hypothetical protein [Photobacterium leiognathi]PSW57090.1 hypothetical protein C0W50_10245 [Photobacterium leiognathi subsp. mandapamensis]
MKRSTKISAIMHKLLIEKGMDSFSVIELRDASLSIGDPRMEPNEARKILYRQILRFVGNGWLESEGEGRDKRYFQTDLFRSLNVTLKVERKSTSSPVKSTPDYSILRHERNQYKAELEIVLGEIDEYQSLYRRFPELEQRLNPMLQQARDRSAHLFGKVNVLTNVINNISSDVAEC